MCLESGGAVYTQGLYAQLSFLSLELKLWGAGYMQGRVILDKIRYIS